jgi:hypothetical protein
MLGQNFNLKKSSHTLKRNCYAFQHAMPQHYNNNSKRLHTIFKLCVIHLNKSFDIFTF